MNKFRSLGVYAFRTPPSDLRDYAPVFRSLCEQGRTERISDMMRAADTMATAGGCSYDVENYLEWSSKIYAQKTSVARWDNDYWLSRTIEFANNQTMNDLKRHHELLAKNYSLFRQQFVPIRWTTVGITSTELKTTLKELIENQCPTGIAVRNLALEERRERTILYARRSFLSTFPAGRAMLNYYTMATNFKKVYGF